MKNNIYASNQFELYSINNEVFLSVKSNGCSINMIQDTIKVYKKICITNHNAIENCLLNEFEREAKVGYIKQRINIICSDDLLEAKLIFDVEENYFDIENRKKLAEETLKELKNRKITFGIITKLFNEKLENNVEYIIAKGVAAVNGTDSYIKMYKLDEPKPSIKEDGNVDHYELNLINTVEAGDWLGERIEATNGADGTTITNKEIKAKPGKTHNLSYDRKTVQEIFLGDKTSLFAKIPGAVFYDGDKIQISDYLYLEGNVDVSTGNIDFDGFVKVEGTIEDGFSVVATRDIEVESQYGIGNAKSITSKEGSIYVKGGIVSKDIIKIECKKNFYSKFIDKVDLKCGGMTNIGFYCKDSIVKTKEFIIESKVGVINGSHIIADAYINSAIVGSKLEMDTCVEVTGIDKEMLVDNLFEANKKEETLIENLESLEKRMESHKNDSTSYDEKAFSKLIDLKYSIEQEIKSIQEKVKNIERYLTYRGLGEIKITSCLYPNTKVIIKDKVLELDKKVLKTIYYYDDGEIKTIE